MGRGTVYNPMVTEEKLKMVNEDNVDLLNEFVEFLQSTDKSPLTIRNYVSDIQICFIWSLEHNKNKFFIDFTKRDIMKYQNYMLNKMNLSSNRIRRLRSAISSMSNFIEAMLDDEYPNYRNIVNKIPAPVKQAVREKSIFEDEEIQKLLDYLVDKKQYQKACVLALAWASGSRKSELLRFPVSYFIPENIKYGSLYKTPEKIKTKGRGSKGKMIYRYVLISKFQQYLDLWLEQRKELGVTCDELFAIKRKGKWTPMQITTLDSWAKLFTKLLNKDFYFHSLRHNFCTFLSQSNIPASVIKDIIGWENVSMVEVYDDSEVDDKLGKYFGKDGIKQVTKGDLSNL
ncbi:integrase [Clostridium botulinum]|uniref:tyrosine-type recombinase/integrase n=1 Tax=Clostridium botulinum TaxID=1491 RepID=UPI0009943BEE|nr:site-specific integrase [Clostridium botulinum]NFO99185.1 integrase [Clostridium botulinum]OOV53056.1 integrase [Clostridium botulinum D/C]OOV58376.1 integrase [Clostridium botulinum D/C]OOV59561.1 integrase [Clostridium botulinum D/C]